MGATLYFHRYPKACDNPKIIPFLSIFDFQNCNGKLPKEFYDSCREFGEYNAEGDCYIFRDNIRLFEFAERKEVPASIADYISGVYPSPRDPDYEDSIFIIWIR